ncbi:hypothetical protein [Megamonas hypermegale]|uniref:hypothetical protein n=1 Tax=Megamonas hypermegale TaxID=158847 RepID=UPI003207D81E
MPKKIIMLVLVCILFPAVVFANQNPNAVPGFDNLTWGESANSVSQKYGLNRMGNMSYDRNISTYSVQLKNSYLYDIRVLPEVYLFFINDKLYSLSFKFNLAANERDYNNAKNILINKFGEPNAVNADSYYEYTSWQTDIYSITLSVMGISFVNKELSPQVEISTQKARERKTPEIDWDKYAH